MTRCASPPRRSRRPATTDGQALTAALEKTDGFKIFSGPLKFTPEHTLSAGGFDILVVKDNGFVPNK